MKNILIATMLVMLGAGSLFAKEMWRTDWTEAQKAAVSAKKPMLVLFTGSDWCPWCVRLEKEILSKPEVVSYVNRNFIAVKLDFPRDKKISDSERKANILLAQKYRVAGFPTILYFSPDGKRLKTKGGYMKGGPNAFIEHLKTVQTELRSGKK